MANISRGPTLGDFVTIRTKASMQDITDTRLQSTRVGYRLPSPPSFKCNGLRESLSVDSQNIPSATLKRRWSCLISVQGGSDISGILSRLHCHIEKLFYLLILLL
jgi:hypothetical protein